ncbi:carbohydrate-binding protein [Enterococcus plantarum]|uniref:carbohydrate-binding protein n=1 Tax=Enterococcus plantarum TaxID=1077675 RepID=UPI001A909BE2|nr:carbohydrate-binding protein [Enterococcus plantarum]
MGYKIYRDGALVGMGAVKTKESTTPLVTNAWDAAKAYNGGDVVTYQGKTYKPK